MSGRTRIEVVEDETAVASSLAALLEAYGFRPVVFGTGEAFLAGASAEAACALIDVRLPGIDGVETVRRMRAAGSKTPVVIVTGHGHVALAVAALQAGAQDVLEKPYDDADLMRRIDNARAAAPAGEADPAEAEFRARFATLTPRETEVMREVVAGRQNKVIARRLGLSPKTVEIHRSRVMDKTGAENLSQLVRMAMKAGFDPDEASQAERRTGDRGNPL